MAPDGYIFFMLCSSVFSITTNDFYTTDERFLVDLGGNDDSVLINTEPPFPFFGNVYDNLWVSSIFTNKHVSE